MLQVFYVIVLPSIIALYSAIFAAAASHLRTKFGAEYDAYCQRVHRWFARLQGSQTVDRGHAVQLATRGVNGEDSVPLGTTLRPPIKLQRYSRIRGVKNALTRR